MVWDAARYSFIVRKIYKKRQELTKEKCPVHEHLPESGNFQVRGTDVG